MTRRPIMAHAELQAEVARLAEALLHATAALVGAASAYRKYASRHRDAAPVRALADPFFSTRIEDFDRAAKAAQTALTKTLKEETLTPEQRKLLE